MAETIAAVGELILCAGLLIAVWLFIFGAFTRGEFEHRIVAAGSSLVALIGYCTIYSGQIRRISIQAISHWTADPTTINRADDHFRDADQFFTRLANYLSPGEHVGYRPYPTLIPLIILASVFTIRSLIYFSVTRRRFPDAGVTGPVYWSHISAYVMLVSFFIVIVNWNVAIVIAGSLALIVALIVPNLLEDIIFIVKSFFSLLFAYRAWRHRCYCASESRHLTSSPFICGAYSRLLYGASE